MESYKLIAKMEFKSLMKNIESFNVDFKSEEKFETLENKIKMFEWSKKDLESAKRDIDNLIDTINKCICMLNLKSQKGGI